MRFDSLNIGYILKTYTLLFLRGRGFKSMPRPKKCLCEKIDFSPPERCFRPCGAPAHSVLETRLSTEEFEAFRLRYFEGLEQEIAAMRMGTSQSTYQRILEHSAGKIAQALADGHALFIDLPYSHS